MTNEERNIIQDFITRVSGGPPASGQPGSVPTTVAPLPAVDREADQLIGQLFTQYPDARYRLTQTAFVQEHALAAAQSRIERLEWELNQAKQIAAQPQQATPQGGFFSGLFSGGRPPQPSQAPPQQQQPVWNQGAPQYSQPPQGQPQFAGPPPQYQQPGMFQRQGSGFLGSALTTAAGVAGGMVAGNALMGLFHGGSSGIGAGMGGGMSGGGGAPSPWATPAALPEPPIPPQNDVDSGSWDTSGATTSNDDWNRQDSAPASPPDNAPDSSNWGDSGGNDWGGSGGSDC